MSELQDSHNGNGQTDVHTYGRTYIHTDGLERFIDCFATKNEEFYDNKDNNNEKDNDNNENACLPIYL